MSRKHTGICHICGKEGELTSEHIPPRNALNNQSAKMYSGDGLIKRMQGEKSKYEIQQAGAGKYSLCASCNNNTGQWYAPAYNLMAKATAWNLQKAPKLQHGDIFAFTTKEFSALEFVKQVITMFCSMLPYSEVKRLGFDKLILDKLNNNVDTSLFDLRMYLAPSESVRLSIGPFVVLNLDKQTNEIENVSATEIEAYPFGFILNLNPANEITYGASLLPLLDAEYGKKYSMEWRLQYLERINTELPLPLQFKPIKQFDYKEEERKNP